MRALLLAGGPLLVALACANPSEPEPNLILETDQAAYVASDDPDPRFDYTITVITKFRNETSGVIRVNGCTASSTKPSYLVQMTGSGVAAWTPDVTCLVNGAPYRDVAAGAELTDTLTLRAPWQRLFNGTPVGQFEGEFRLLYDVQICGSVNRFGNCLINNRFDFARSNTFTISTP